MASANKELPKVKTVKLPWGAEISVRLKENLGSAIYWYGIHDRIVPETIWRLMDRGETGIDIGANIGQNSSAMAVRSGAAGRVIAFEPHPLTFGELQQNMANLAGVKRAPVTLENVALGKEAGESVLIASEFLTGATLASEGEGIKVMVRSLDSFLADMESVGVCKIDVEGYELEVLEGASAILSRKAIRDLIFEDFNPMPSPVVMLLQRHGYTVFELYAGWMKPALKPISASGSHGPGFSCNYLATIDPQRAARRFRVPGWRCLMNL